MLRRLLFVAFFVEVGLLLIVLPWSSFWERNYFAFVWPTLLPLIQNNFVTGRRQRAGRPQPAGRLLGTRLRLHFPRVILHLVTDRRRLAPLMPFEDARRCLLRQVQYAVDAGIDCIIVRERDLEARDLADLTAAVVGLTRGTQTRVVVNDRVDVALAAGADGVHLRGDSMPPEAVRRMTPSGFLLGRSVHGAKEAAAVTGVDYLIAGTVWSSASKAEGHPLLGLDGFSAIVKAVRVPVLAIGGVAIDRVGDIASAGGAGIAAIGLFMDDAEERVPCCAARCDRERRTLRGLTPQDLAPNIRSDKPIRWLTSAKPERRAAGTERPIEGRRFRLQTSGSPRTQGRFAARNRERDQDFDPGARSP